MEAPALSLVGKDKADQRAAILFVHGFTGKSAPVNRWPARMQRSPAREDS